MDEKWLERLVDKLDKQDDRIGQVDVALAEIKIDLKEHMRRSLANEEANALTRQHLDLVKQDMDKRVSGLERIKDRFYFVGWLILGLLGVFQTLKETGLF